MADATPTTSLGFDNFFQATLTGDITASSTDILMDTIPTSSEGFLVIEPDSTTAREIIYYNSKTALKVVCPDASTGRGQGGTTAGAHSTGATVIMAPVAELWEALQSGLSMNAKAIKFNTPQGFLQNGQISRTVNSNNITVAIKTLAGNDPSASDPVIVRIGNSIRTITSALSVTKNAGTNWFGSGGTMFATLEVDYFVYLGYNATDGVTIGFARIPSARIYGDFSTTTTAETYCAISTITNATSTDEYELVGRFNATLSAAASFNWSVPGTSVIINRPIFETRTLSYVPTFTSLSGGSLNYGKYIISGKRVYVRWKYTLAGAGVSGAVSSSVPFAISSDLSNTNADTINVAVTMLDSGTGVFDGYMRWNTSTTMQILLRTASGSYTSAAVTSSTIPFTWATNDYISCSGHYDMD